MKNKSKQDHIENEFKNYLEHVYPGTVVPPNQLREIKQAFIAGMLTVFAIRKKMSESTGIAFVDGHCDTISKQVLDYGNALVAKNSAERN